MAPDLYQSVWFKQGVSGLMNLLGLVSMSGEWKINPRVKPRERGRKTVSRLNLGFRRYLCCLLTFQSNIF